MTSNKRFLVSVADVIGRDATSGNALFYGKTNISSAFTTSMTAVEGRGGKGNPLQVLYYHSKKLEINVEDNP